MVGQDQIVVKTLTIVWIQHVFMVLPVSMVWVVFIVDVHPVKRAYFVIWTMPALLIHVMPMLFVIQAPLMVHLRALVLPATKV